MDARPAILAVALPLTFFMAFRVRREEALQRDAYIYAASGAAFGFGVGWTAGFGLFALVFVPFAGILCLLDGFYKIFDVLLWFTGGGRQLRSTVEVTARPELGPGRR